jgi:hypothetical protein
MVAASQTFEAFGESRLARLCSSLGLSRQRSLASNVFRSLAESWSSWPHGPSPAWATDICDDGTPFEFSVAFEGLVPTLRILVESQQAPTGATSTWTAGLRLSERLKKWPGVDLARHNAVLDLFAPRPHVPARFSLWHAVDIAPDGRTSFKAYFNPRVAGPDSSVAITVEALRRLKMDRAADFLEARVRDAGTPFYFSVDLSSAPGARVKVYLGHKTTHPEALERALEGCLHYVPGDATRWITRLAGTPEPSAERPVLSCFSFVSHGAAPLVTVHVPIRCYVRSDAEALERTAAFLSQRHQRLLRSAADALASRSLDARPGLISYVSLRRTATDLRVATYLSPEAYGVPRSERALSSVSDAAVAQ